MRDSRPRCSATRSCRNRRSNETENQLTNLFGRLDRYRSLAIPLLAGFTACVLALLFVFFG